MSSNGSITFDWADGEHTFRLPIGQLRELQDKCGVGPMKVLARLTDRDWTVDDVRETLRLGLIGGGMPPSEALVLTKRYVDNIGVSWMENAMAAQNVLLAALVGVKEDPVGKVGTEETATKTSTGSTSPSSMVSEPPSDGQQDRLMS